MPSGSRRTDTTAGSAESECPAAEPASRNDPPGAAPLTPVMTAAQTLMTIAATIALSGRNPTLAMEAIFIDDFAATVEDMEIVKS